MILRKQPGCWLRSSHSFKECVIAHWSSEVARKITGAKLFTEIADSYSNIRVVEEHSIVGRSIIERIYGRDRRENAGISSESKVRIFAVESLRFLGEGSSAQGKSGPKVRPKGVADGQQVKIPALLVYLKDARDAGVEGKRGRGKTRIERYSEIKVTNFQEAH